MVEVETVPREYDDMHEDEDPLSGQPQPGDLLHYADDVPCCLLDNQVSKLHLSTHEPTENRQLDGHQTVLPVSCKDS